MTPIPESGSPTSPPPRLARARALTRVLDSALTIPGTRLRIGLDPLMGLVPWAGDAAGALASVYLIWQSAKLGAPRSTLVRMIANVGLETVIGVIPVVGDVFDAFFKANTRNLALLEMHVHDPGAAGLASRRFWTAVATGLGVSFVGIVAVAWWVLWTLARVLGLL